MRMNTSTMKMRRLCYGSLIFAVFLFATSASVLVYAQAGLNDFPPETNIKFTSERQFEIPEKNSTINFSSGGSYANATLTDGVWDFSGLFVTGGLSMLPNTNGVKFSASAANSKVTINHLDVLNLVPPDPGSLEYTVNGVGSQTFNLQYRRLELIVYRVEIDGEAKAKDDGWTLSTDGWITVTTARSKVTVQWAEPSITSFPIWTSFQLPATNGSVIFASKGTYLGDPRQENNTWYFQNLSLNDSEPRGIPLWNLAIASQNCNVTVKGYDPAGLTGLTNVAAWLNYSVTGPEGASQKVNLNYGSLNGVGPYKEMNYTIIIDGENRTEGDGWVLLNDGWINITGAGATSNVNIYFPPDTSMNGLPLPGVPTIYAPVPTVTSSPIITPSFSFPTSTARSESDTDAAFFGLEPSAKDFPLYVAAVVIIAVLLVAAMVAVKKKRPAY